MTAWISEAINTGKSMCSNYEMNSLLYLPSSLYKALFIHQHHLGKKPLSPNPL